MKSSRWRDGSDGRLQDKLIIPDSRYDFVIKLLIVYAILVPTDCYA